MASPTAPSPHDLPSAPPARSGPVLFVFLDGVGLGEADPGSNPFFRARLPVWRGLLDGEPPHLRHPLLAGGNGGPFHVDPPSQSSSGPTFARLFALDATLGVPGLPQSGTGQISLLTGENAAERFGAHFGPWPPVRLRPLLEAENLFRRLQNAGHSVHFANAYPEGYPAGVSSRRVAAPALAAHMAGVLNSGPDELIAGEAVSSEIDNEGWRRFTGLSAIPRITAADAGEVLGRLSTHHDFTFFAHYGTDTAGHRGGMVGAVAALERVDAFLGGVLRSVDPDTCVLVAADHGNIEEVGRGHTMNPALGMVIGPRRRVETLSAPTSLIDVVPRVFTALAG